MDLFGDTAGPDPTTASRADAAQAALALACAWAHALSYPNRERGPSDQWLNRYAETQGRADSARLHQALHRLPIEQRRAIAADLLAE
jgi:hypothetical protein